MHSSFLEYAEIRWLPSLVPFHNCLLNATSKFFGERSNMRFEDDRLMIAAGHLMNFKSIRSETFPTQHWIWIYPPGLVGSKQGYLARIELGNVVLSRSPDFILDGEEIFRRRLSDQRVKLMACPSILIIEVVQSLFSDLLHS